MVDAPLPLESAQNPITTVTWYWEWDPFDKGPSIFSLEMVLYDAYTERLSEVDAM